MKLSFLISDAGFIPETIETTSTVTLEKSDITESNLVVKGRVPDMDKKQFEELAEKSKNECPVSKALKLKITLEASMIEEVHDGEIKI
jgi:osmotically inducible protein OsmC